MDREKQGWGCSLITPTDREPKPGYKEELEISHSKDKDNVKDLYKVLSLDMNWTLI